MVNEFVNNLW